MAFDDGRAAGSAGNIILEGRERLSISGVTDVLSFDEGEVVAETTMGLLVTAGEDLHVERLSLDVGELVLTGRISALEYVGDRKQKGGLWSKLF
ncbi:MAG: sporulation protein YabP [Clostridia bacterium]|nr:sporulation protein YabP [Clostridia bacterium]MBQ9926331.1 sporulation protein YabP [Clostridia bacterium]